MYAYGSNDISLYEARLIWLKMHDNETYGCSFIILLGTLNLFHILRASLVFSYCLKRILSKINYKHSLKESLFVT